jgi:AraC-like DNA-binding protein
MLQRGDNGLRFSQTTSAAVRSSFETIFEKPPVERLLALLGILVRVAEDRQATPLASAPAQAPDLKESRERIDRVLTHMHLHYARAISLDELADIAALSVSGLHRMFRRHTGGTISDYLMRMRIGDACARLSSTDQAIHHISDAVGYLSLANFNRQFRVLKGMTPREYRAMFLRR